MKSDTLQLTVPDYETDETVVLPSKVAVCKRCNGSGVHDHPAFSNGLSREDFEEDPDFRESYFAGHYDVQCSECDGLRVVAVANFERFTDRHHMLFDAYCQARSEDRAERRMRERGIEF